MFCGLPTYTFVSRPSPLRILFCGPPYLEHLLFYGPPYPTGLLFCGPPLFVGSPPCAVINDVSLRDRSLFRGVGGVQSFSAEVTRTLRPSQSIRKELCTPPISGDRNSIPLPLTPGTLYPSHDRFQEVSTPPMPIYDRKQWQKPGEGGSSTFLVRVC